MLRRGQFGSPSLPPPRPLTPLESTPVGVTSRPRTQFSCVNLGNLPVDFLGSKVGLGGALRGENWFASGRRRISAASGPTRATGWPRSWENGCRGNLWVTSRPSRSHSSHHSAWPPAQPSLKHGPHGGGRSLLVASLLSVEIKFPILYP